MTAKPKAKSTARGGASARGSRGNFGADAHGAGIERELWRTDASPDSTPRVDTGPTMLWRARALVAASFLFAVPAIGIGLARTSEAVAAVGAFTIAQSMFDSARAVENRVLAADLALVRFENEPTFDRARQLTRGLDTVSRTIIALDKSTFAALDRPELEAQMRAWTFHDSPEPLLGASPSPLAALTSAIGRARRAIDPQTNAKGLKNGPDAQEFQRAEIAISTAENFITTLASRSLVLTRARAAGARGALTRAGRDLLVTLVLLVLVFFVFAFFGPSYMLSPLQRLRGLATRIEVGRVRDVNASGRDEVAEVSRALQDALRRLEDNDHRKTHKILEMRKLLREVLAHASDAILILSPGARVDYVNPSAAQLLGREAHHIEQAPLSDALFSPALSDSIEHAREGDVVDHVIPVTIEIGDGRVEKLDAELGVIRDSAGDVTRVIVVMRRRRVEDAESSSSRPTGAESSSSRPTGAESSSSRPTGAADKRTPEAAALDDAADVEKARAT